MKVEHAVVSHSKFKCSFSKLTHANNMVNQYIGFWRSLWYRKQAQTMYTKTIDQIVGDTQCGSIVIDLGGYELAALHGAAATIARDLPNLVVKFDPQTTNINLILDILHELDYNAYYLVNVNPESWSIALEPILEPCNHCDPQFALCIPKKEQLPHGLKVLAIELPKTGNDKFDKREQVLEDIKGFRPVPMNPSLEKDKIE